METVTSKIEDGYHMLCVSVCVYIYVYIVTVVIVKMIIPTLL
jgi:hypothetical protein